MEKLVKCKACQKEISNDAKTCPGCGKEQKNWFMRHKIITFVGGFILLIIIASATSNDTKTQTTNTPVQAQQQTETPKEQSIIVSSEVLAKAFEDNEIKANGQYKDKLVKVTGKINNIGEALGSTYIVLSSGKEFSVTNVQCFFEDKNEINKIANMNKGDIVTVNGKVDGKSMNVSVKKCTFESK